MNEPDDFIVQKFCQYKVFILIEIYGKNGNSVKQKKVISFKTTV